MELQGSHGLNAENQMTSDWFFFLPGEWFLAVPRFCHRMEGISG